MMRYFTGLLAAGALFASPAFAETPASVTGLDASHTIAVMGVQGLDKIMANVAELAGIVAPFLPPDAPPEAKDPSKWAAKLHFDALTVEGWRGIGLDSGLGFAVTIDDRIRTTEHKPGVVLALGLPDRDALLKFIGGHGEKAPTLEARDGLTYMVNGKGKALPIGARGGLTYIGLDDKPLDGFSAFLKSDGTTLGASGALSDMGQRPGVFGFMKTMAAAEAFLPAHKMTDDVRLYTRLFPSVSLWMTADDALFRLGTSAAGHEALRKVLVPKAASPKFSAYVPAAGYAAMMHTINIPELFDGLKALAPPSAPQVQQQLTAAPALSGGMLGVSWPELGRALSGHVVVSLKLPPIVNGELEKPKPEDGVLMLGVADPKAADAFIEAQLVRNTMARLKGERAKVAGREGWRFKVGPKDAWLVRVDRIILVAFSEAPIKVALSTKAALTGEAAKALDGGAIMGVAIDSMSYRGELFTKAGLTKVQIDTANQAATKMGAVGKLWTASHLTMSVSLGPKGMEMRGVGSTAGLTGMLAAIAIPAFTKYVKRSKAAAQRQKQDQKKLK